MLFLLIVFNFFGVPSQPFQMSVKAGGEGGKTNRESQIDKYSVIERRERVGQTKEKRTEKRREMG